MTTAQISRIAPPPSVEAVLGALTEATRIGQVDFSSRLAPEPEPGETEATLGNVEVTEPAGWDLPADPEGDEAADPTDDGDADAATTVFTTLKAVADLADQADADDSAQIEDAAPAAKPQRGRQAPAADPEPEAPAPAPAPKRATKTKGLGKGLANKRRAAKPTDAATDLAAEPVTRSMETVDTVETVEEHTVPAPLVERIHSPATLDDLAEGETHGLVMPDLDERPPTVEEIARLVVERMNDAELAMMRHLEAIEAEASRRCELLTAQAELDAELIRLNARREAHGIVTDARLRAEGRAGLSPELHQLDELTESLSRFADVVDELRPSAPRSPAGLMP